MGIIWVAYNDYGDLVAESCSYRSLLWQIDSAGYCESDVLVCRVHP